MTPEAVLYPMLVMFLITFFIAIRLAVLRYRAVVQDGLHPGYFKHNRGAKPPEYLLRTTDHYDNLFEQPMLFYIGTILVYVTGESDGLFLLLGWSYVASRILHGYIHIKLNKLIWRRNSFALAFIILFIQWVYLFAQLALK